MSSARFCFAALLAFLFVALPLKADEPQKSKIDWSANIYPPLTSDVAAACESKNAADQAFCYGEIMSAYDANLYFADLTQITPLCLPDTTTPDQLRAAVMKMAKDRPTQLGGDFDLFFYMAVSEAYPCKAVRPVPAPASAKKAAVPALTEPSPLFSTAPKP